MTIHTTDYYKNEVLQLNTKKIAKLKNEQKMWIDILSKKRYDWLISIWKFSILFTIREVHFCGILVPRPGIRLLVPQPGIELESLQRKHGVLTSDFQGIPSEMQLKITWDNLHIFCHKEVKRKSLSHNRLLATPWTTESMESSKSEYWSG